MTQIVNDKDRVFNTNKVCTDTEMILVPVKLPVLNSKLFEMGKYKNSHRNSETFLKIFQ